jgi:hypothetical protein
MGPWGPNLLGMVNIKDLQDYSVVNMQFNSLQNRRTHLKGHWHEKSVSNKHIGRCLGPSVWTVTMFKNVLVVPLVASRRSLIKSVAGRRSLEKSSLYIFTCLPCGCHKTIQGADRIKLISGVGRWAYRKRIKNMGPAQGIKLICGPGTLVRRFLHW